MSRLRKTATYHIKVEYTTGRLDDLCVTTTPEEMAAHDYGILMSGKWNLVEVKPIDARVEVVEP